MKILLIGANGRMGTQMQKYMTNKNIDFFAVDKQNFEQANKEQFDVIVDFSSPQALEQNLQLAKAKKKPILIACTNHDKNNLKLMKLASKNIAIALCPNLSVGVMAFSKMLECMAAVKDYDFVLTEIHHKQKKDAPSGTAKQIIYKLDKLNIRPETFAVRAGSIIGEHSLVAFGENEVVEIKHTALSRNCFCEGAIKVCEKLTNSPAGFYSIEELL